jgi:hypothetical protein
MRAVFSMSYQIAISKTAPIGAKTHVWPIDAVHNDWPIRDRYWAYPGKNLRRFLIGCRLLRAQCLIKCVIDTHIILVRAVRSIQNSCIKNTPLKISILLKCSLTLTILTIIWISIIFLFQFNWDIIYLAIIHVSDVSDDADRIFACRSQCTLSTKHPNLHYL